MHVPVVLGLTTRMGDGTTRMGDGDHSNNKCHGGRYGSPLERVGDRVSKSKQMAEKFHTRPGLL